MRQKLICVRYLVIPAEAGIQSCHTKADHWPSQVRRHFQRPEWEQRPILLKFLSSAVREAIPLSRGALMVSSARLRYDASRANVISDWQEIARSVARMPF